VSGFSAGSANGGVWPAVDSVVGSSLSPAASVDSRPWGALDDDALALAGGASLPAQAPKPSLLLIDDVRLRRECLLHLLSIQLPDFEVTAAPQGASLESLATGAPNLVVLTAAASGAKPIGEIVAAARGAPVLLLADTSSDEGARTEDEAGVAGRFPTACGASLLIAAIRLVLAGGRFRIPSPNLPRRGERTAPRSPGEGEPLDHPSSSLG